jgi:transcriptional regulator MraZ
MWGSVEEKGTNVAELLGQHRYQLDAKGRMALPGKFREPFADGLFLTLGEDGCLYAFPKDEWDRRREELRATGLTGREARARARMFFGNAERVDLDGQGRVVVPQKLRAQVGLGREAVVIGVSDWLEIWPSARWDEYERTHATAYAGGALDPRA